MPKPRKMFSDLNAPCIQSLMRAIVSQNTATIARWCTDYARAHILPLWARAFPDDMRPLHALDAAQAYLDGTLSLPEAKKRIMDCRQAARGAEGHPIPQGAARTVDAAACAIYNPASALGLALYGAVTIAYEQISPSAPWGEVCAIAQAECTRMEQALRAISVENEPNPAKIDWNC